MVFAFVAIASAMAFGGVELLNQVKKQAIIDTPEISTEISGEVDATDGDDLYVHFLATDGGNVKPKKQQKATPINQKAIDMFNKNK